MRTQRPLILTVTCVLLSIFLILAIVANATALTKNFIWYDAVFLFGLIIGIPSIVGMWKMQKWGVILYSFISVLSQLMFMTVNKWEPTFLITPFIVIAVNIFVLSGSRQAKEQPAGL
ncbi:hypothetical protein [Paradesertivirga mongoliensis]|uniref:hypothetical protein n=1 Tax=Paradesertivirga mongoliensis TaxID=2100740 RepID=UPI0036D23081